MRSRFRHARECARMCVRAQHPVVRRGEQRQHQLDGFSLDHQRPRGLAVKQTRQTPDPHRFRPVRVRTCVHAREGTRIAYIGHGRLHHSLRCAPTDQLERLGPKALQRVGYRAGRDTGAALRGKWKRETREGMPTYR